MVKIRSVEMQDIASLLTIYRPYVLETAVSFETELPSLSEFCTRVQEIKDKFPYLVAEEDGQILGYAYAHTYYDRAAYNHTAEVSVYLADTAKGRGLGHILYDDLEKQLAQQGVTNFLACITADNTASLNFHQKRGYKKVGHFYKVGRKFDTWHDIIWL